MMTAVIILYIYTLCDEKRKKIQTCATGTCTYQKNNNGKRNFKKYDRD